MIFFCPGVLSVLRSRKQKRKSQKMEEARLKACRDVLDTVYDMLNTRVGDWDSRLSPARTTMATLDELSFMTRPNREQEQVWIIGGLQRLAYHDPDNGGISDIATWCLRQWLEVTRNHPESVIAITGLGDYWLSRAQSSLARIHRQEASGSSSGGASIRTGNSYPSFTSSQDERLANLECVEAESRIHTADYVEARGLLLPATEYFTRAVDVARTKNQLTPNLLVSAAEAFMSLGNVCTPRSGERYFRTALHHLKNAAEMPGYDLPSYLQQYLDDYGRLIE